jgi:bifunctional DNA-binding transcriptional regulator/antitoxin component of YhaV-PrlF toxin-antitoxin module
MVSTHDPRHWQVSDHSAQAPRGRVRHSRGDEVEIIAAGESIAIRPAGTGTTALSAEERLRHFDETTRRQELRQRNVRRSAAKDRGWTREELYPRGRPR